MQAEAHWNHQAVGDVWLRMAKRSIDGQVVPVMPAADDRASLAAALPEDVYSPMSHGTLESYHKTMRAQKQTLAKVHAATQARFNAFCRAEAGLLGSVEYPATCGELCRDPGNTPELIVQMRDDLVSSWATVMKSVGGFKSILASEIVFVILSGRSQEDVRVRFLSVPACLAQSGPHEAAQLFVESDLLGDPIRFGDDKGTAEVNRVLQNRRLQLASVPGRSLEITPRLPRVFRDSMGG